MSPVEAGVVLNWTDLGSLLNYVLYDELKINPEDHWVLIIDNFRDKTNFRKKIASILFEKHNVAGISFLNQSLGALNRYGKTTGVVLEWSEGVSNVVAIVEGIIENDALYSFQIAGKDIKIFILNTWRKRIWF